MVYTGVEWMQGPADDRGAAQQLSVMGDACDRFAQRRLRRQPVLTADVAPLPPGGIAAVAAGAAILGALVGAASRPLIARVPGARGMRRPWLEAVTALAFALVAAGAAHLVGRSADGWAATPVGVALVGAAFLCLAAASVVLAIVDVQTRRLPDAVVLPCYASGIVLLGAATLASGDLSAAVRAGVGLAVMGGFYLLLRMLRPDGMGGGDVKLAGVLGLHLGWLGWAPLGVGAVAAFLLGGMVSLVVIATRRGGRYATIAFGPWMIAGAWIGVVWGGPLVALYTGSLLRA